MLPCFGALVLGWVYFSWVTLTVHVTNAQVFRPVFRDRPFRVSAQSRRSCFNYHLRVNSNNTDYYYTCCGTLGGVTGKTDTNFKVPVFNFDCNPFRLNRTEITQQRDFACNERTKAERLCNRRWGWLSTDDCWVWSSCFEEACQLEPTEPNLVCGDGRCENGERGASCPLDCCPQENPETCIIKNNTCSSRCCGEPSCCQEVSQPVSVSSQTFWLIVGTVVAAVFCLLYCCCFCCCCCCNSLFKSMFRTSKKRRHSVVFGAGMH